jgi:hypothetical protein
MKLRNAPTSILIASVLLAIGAALNFVIGLLLSLVPEIFRGIDTPTTPEGAPSQLILISGVACIAVGFVYIWIIKELLIKSQFAIVMIYTLSVINILFGLFRMPLGLLTISLNLLAVVLVRTKSAKQWLNSTS